MNKQQRRHRVRSHVTFQFARHTAYGMLTVALHCFRTFGTYFPGVVNIMLSTNLPTNPDPIQAVIADISSAPKQVTRNETDEARVDD